MIIPKKNCSFCKRLKKQYNHYLYISIYLIILVVWGQVEMIKWVWNLLSKLW